MDGVTYESGLEDRLVDLHGRVHRGAYRALPSRRVYIQKEDGRQRPLGVAALEDKVVQQAVVTILNQIFEEDFLGFSYGFRPGRSQHDALDALSYALLKKKVNWEPGSGQPPPATRWAISNGRPYRDLIISNQPSRTTFRSDASSSIPAAACFPRHHL